MTKNKPTCKEKSALSAALKRLAIRPYSCAELECYLASQGFSGEEINPSIARLAEWGYLNDWEVARKVLEHHIRIKPSGRLFIRYKLQQKGLPQDIVAAVLEEYSEDEEYRLLLKTAQVYLRKKSARQAPNIGALARYLAQKGYPSSLIKKAIEERFTTSD